MNDIEELRQRVVDAEERFGLIDEQRAKYSERLILLMDAIEGRIHEQQGAIDRHAAIIEKYESEAADQQSRIDGQAAEIAQHAGEVEKLKAAAARKDEENEQLRAMLHSLLQAIEAGGGNGLADTLQTLYRKVSALASTVAAEESEAEPEPEPKPESGIEAPEAAMETAAEAQNVEIEETEEIEEPVAEAGEPVTGESGEAVPETAAETTAEEEPVAEAGEPVPENAAETIAEEEPVAEAGEIVPEIAAERPNDGLDEIIGKISRLVEETEAKFAAPEPSAPGETTAEAAGDIAEDMALPIARDSGNA